MGITDLEKDEIVKAATHTSGALASALKVSRAIPGIKVELLGRLKMQLLESLPPNLALEWYSKERLEMAQYAGFVIVQKSDPGLRVHFQFDQSAFRGLVYGVSFAEGLVPSIDQERVHDALSARFGGGKKHMSWIWYKNATVGGRPISIAADWDSSELPWVSIIDHSLAPIMVAWAQQVFDALGVKSADLPPSP